MANLTREERALRNAAATASQNEEQETVTATVKKSKTVIVDGVECNEYGMAKYDKLNLKPIKREYITDSGVKKSKLIGVKVVGTFSENHLLPPAHVARMNKQIDWKGYGQQDEFEYLQLSGTWTIGMSYHAELEQREIGLGQYENTVKIDFNKPYNK